jgi:hypothetical protein
METKQSLHIFKILAMGRANNNRIKWQMTVAVLWLEFFAFPTTNTGLKITEI